MLGVIQFSNNNLINSIFVLTVSILIAVLIDLFFILVYKNLTKRTSTQYDDLIFKNFRTPMYISVVLAGIYYALASYGLRQEVIGSTRNILISIGFIIWAFFSARFTSMALDQLKGRLSGDRESKIDSDMVPFINNLIQAGLVGLALLMILDLWGIDVTPILASAGVAGVAVAFAAKDTVSNLFGGISIFMDRPYRVGDYVLIDDQYRGEVEEIGMRSTKIKTRDNILITVPNAVMVTQSVINETGYDPKMRIRIEVGVSYNSDLEQVEKILVEVAKSHEGIIDESDPVVRFRSFAESSIRLELMAYIELPEDRGRITHELIKAIHYRFDKENIVIPFPQRDVHLSNGQ